MPALTMVVWSACAIAKGYEHVESDHYMGSLLDASYNEVGDCQAAGSVVDESGSGGQDWTKEFKDVEICVKAVGEVRVGEHSDHPLAAHIHPGLYGALSISHATYDERLYPDMTVVVVFHRGCTLDMARDITYWRGLPVNAYHGWTSEAQHESDAAVGRFVLL